MWLILGVVSLPYRSKAHAHHCLVEERDPHVRPFFASSSPPTGYPHLCAPFHYLAALWPFLSWQTPARTPRCHTWGSPPPCRVGSSSPPAHSPPAPWAPVASCTWLPAHGFHGPQDIACRHNTDFLTPR